MQHFSPRGQCDYLSSPASGVNVLHEVFTPEINQRAYADLSYSNHIGIISGLTITSLLYDQRSCPRSIPPPKDHKSFRVQHPSAFSDSRRSTPSK